jgi:hypothetical protein
MDAVFNCEQPSWTAGRIVDIMFKTVFSVTGVALVLCTSALSGQAPPHYREFTLGSTLSTVSTQVKASPADVKPIHQRPALIQDLSWRAPYFVANSNEPRKDPVQQILFSFYNDQLFRMAIDYDRQRTEGLTDADMIAALTDVYGPATPPKPKAPPAFLSLIDITSGTPVSQWGTAEYSVVLLRPSFGAGFQVVVTSIPLDALARKADAEAVRLDQREAPLREIARQKQDADDVRASQEKARATNKATFRP